MCTFFGFRPGAPVTLVARPRREVGAAVPGITLGTTPAAADGRVVATGTLQYSGAWEFVATSGDVQSTAPVQASGPPDLYRYPNAGLLPTYAVLGGPPNASATCMTNLLDPFLTPATPVTSHLDAFGFQACALDLARIPMPTAGYLIQIIWKAQNVTLVNVTERYVP